MRPVAILASLSVLFAAPAALGRDIAQTTADPVSTLVDELVVNASLPGPAWWKVSKADATVFILGLPALAPQTLVYDDSLLRRRLQLASRLILAPEPKVGLFGLIGFLFTAKRALSPRTPLSQQLPPAMADRLHSLLARRGQKPDALDKAPLASAGFFLANSDDGKSLILNGGNLQESIEDLARSQAITPHPQIVSTGRYDVANEVKALTSLPPEAQLACFDEGLRTAERGQGGVQAIADQWAKGRVRDLASADRGFEACLSSSPTVAADLRRGIDASTAAIQSALEKPGVSVALVDLRPLLAQDGVLDRLRRRGYDIHTPGEASALH
jgi:uncharacterized protein YbaP (TraB family)